MDRLRGTLLRLRALLRRERVERELEDEVRLHLEMEAEAGVRRGLPADVARREALLRFGGVERFKEEARDARGLGWWEELRRDLHHAARLLKRSPLFTGTAVLTLALGIGANTAIFSVMDAVLLRPTRFAEPERLVMLWETDRDSETRHEPASWPDIVDFRERSRRLEAIGALAGWEGTLTGAGEPERISGLVVTPNLPGLLGVRPVAGRLFAEDEGAPGGAGVALLSEDFWRARFDADPAVIGSTLRLDDVPTTIVGVVPSDADLGIPQIHARADYGARFTGGEVDVYRALLPSAAEYPRETHPFLAVARLARGATLAQAQEELSAIAAELEASYPENDGRGVNLEPYTEVVFGPVRTTLLLLLGAVGLVLLVTCANVANLMLARTAARVREVAVRRALGAGGRRIGRQFLVEGLALTLLGGLAGVALAHVALELLVTLAPADIPRLSSARIDGRVLLFTLAVSGSVGVAFGMMPLLHVRRLDLHEVLKSQPGRTASAGRAGRRVRAGLVVAEVALAVALVVGAGLLLRSFWALRSVDPGFRTERVLKANYALPDTRYPRDMSRWPNLSEIHGFNARFLREVRALPGVEAATLASPHPLEPGFTNSFAIVGREAESRNYPEIRVRFVTPGYLRTLGVPLLAGRAIAEGDVAASTPVIMINRAAAERYFADADPIGQRIAFWGTERQVVGVIGDERFRGVAEPSEPAAYAPLAQAPMQNVALLVRAAGDPRALVPSLRERLRSIDPQLALHDVELLETTLAESIARPRFTALLLGIFAAVAVALALVGVHGVLSYTVAQRAPELGIRLALGAPRARVVRLVVAEGVMLAAVGVALGLLGALAGSRILAGLLFGVSSTDPATFGGVAAAVLATAALASWLPARRASRADPVTALRAE